MPRLIHDSVDARIARVCDPATCNHYIVVYSNPHTGEDWLAARVQPFEVARFREAITQQGCKIVISNRERGEWNTWEWLRHYRKDAPIDLLRKQLEN